MHLRLFVAASLLAGTATVAAAQVAPLADDAKAFGTREAATQVAISPSGNKVVMLVAGPGKSTAAKVFDLNTGEATTPVTAPGDPETLYCCQFATDAQLVCQYGGNLNMTGQIVGFSRLVTGRGCWQGP